MNSQEINCHIWMGQSWKSLVHLEKNDKATGIFPNIRWWGNALDACKGLQIRVKELPVLREIMQRVQVRNDTLHAPSMQITCGVSVRRPFYARKTNNKHHQQQQQQRKTKIIPRVMWLSICSSVMYMKHSEYSIRIRCICSYAVRLAEDRDDLIKCFQSWSMLAIMSILQWLAVCEWLTDIQLLSRILVDVFSLFYFIFLFFLYVLLFLLGVFGGDSVLYLPFDPFFTRQGLGIDSGRPLPVTFPVRAPLSNRRYACECKRPDVSHTILDECEWMQKHSPY